MDDTLSGNRRLAGATCSHVCGTIWFIVFLAPLGVTAQCDRTPHEWIARLSHIEGNDAEIEAKIRALSELKEALAQCDETRDSVHARLLHRLGDFYRLTGDFGKGIALTVEAIRINKADAPGAETAFLTHSYYNLGLYNHLLALSKPAHLYFDSCIVIGMRFPEKMFIAFMALEKKAFMYFQSGDYTQSVATAEYGINIARQKGLYDYEALLLIQKAQSAAELNRIADAEADIVKALSILEQYHLEPWLPNAWSVYAHVLGRKQVYDKAISYYRKAFTLNQTQGNPLQSARDLNDLAMLYDRDLNDAPRSVHYYTQAVRILEELNDRPALATTYSNLGQVCWRRRDFRQALDYYQKGFQALSIDFDEDDADRNAAVDAQKSVSNAYIAAALLWNKGDALLGLYDKDGDARHLERALDAYRMGDRMVDEMRWRQQGEGSKLYWREKTKTWYARAVSASVLMNDPASAFYFMEKSRAVLLNDKLAELGARNALPDAEAQRESDLRIKVQSLESAAAENAAAHVETRERLWEARREVNDFIKRLESAYPSYYRYKYDTAVISLSELQGRLKQDDRTWIEIFANDSALFALSVTSRDAALTRIDFADHARVAKAIMDLCATPHSVNQHFERYRTLSYLYYSKVLQPLGIRPGRVTVSQDEYFLPFDLLHFDSVDATGFLVRDYAFSYAYSASSFFHDAEPDARASRSLFAVAPVTYASRLQLQELSGADASLEKIEASYSDGTYLTREHATRNEFLRQVSEFDVIHLYSHAEADTLGSEPVVYLYDSALNLSDLYRLQKPKARMVVLFACNTGVGKAVRGEGIFSLARGFASAGIPSTVSALWEIDDKTTYGLSELFFENLARGWPSDIALQQAKVEIIDAYGKEKALPYFWAGAVLIGRPAVYSSASVAPSDRSGMVLLVVAIVFVLVIVIAIRRRRA